MINSIEDRLEAILERLEGVKQYGDYRYMALCLAHADTNPSLSIKLEEDRILLNCFAGCSLENICEALGIKKIDLFKSENSKGKTTQDRKDQIERYDLFGGDISEDIEVASYSYYNEAGNLAYVVKRHHPKEFRVVQPDGKPGLNGQKPILYKLPELIVATKDTPVLILEGEKDVDKAVEMGFTATTNPFGAKNWAEGFNKYFEGRYVVVVGDNDPEGKKRVHRIAGQLIGIAASVKVIEALPGVGEKGDLSDWVDAGGTADELRRLIEETAGYNPHEASASEPDDEFAFDPEAVEKGKGFAATLGTRPLKKVSEILKSLGIAGEEDNGKVVYLALTSRLMPKPVNVVVKGHSSGGKSFIVEQNLKLFPVSAYIARTSMSPKTLAHTNEDFKHRTIVIYEAAGISEDWDYLLRSLLSEGQLDYEFVEKTSKGMRTRLIQKEGPTNCLLTTTSYSLHPENETRLLSLSIADNPDQTRAILMARAKAAEEPDEISSVDVSGFQAFQEYLAYEVLKNGLEVVIPFASELARRIDPKAIRLRRDIDQVFTLIKAHALLSIANRKRDEKGRIIAEVEDYEIVRTLINPILSLGVGATIKPEIKETVGAVKKIARYRGDNRYDERPYTSYKELADYLRLDESTVSRRVGEAVKLGYLSKEGGRGKAVKIYLEADCPVYNPDELEHTLLPSLWMLDGMGI